MGSDQPSERNTKSVPIKPPAPYVPKVNVGLILNVSNENLNELIKFNGKECFLRNFCSDLKSRIITLINGNKDTPFYELNNVMKSAIKYFEEKRRRDSLAFGACFLYGFFFKIPTIFQLYLWELYSHFSSKDSIPEYELENSDTILDNISQLEFFSKANKFPVSLCNKNEEIPNNFESKSLIIKLKYLIEKLSKVNNNFEKKYIIIISDGITLEKSEKAKELIIEARKKNIIIVTFLISKDIINEKKNFENFNNQYSNNNKNSIANYKNTFTKYFLEKDLLSSGKGKGIYLFQTTLEDLNNPDNSFTNCLKKISSQEMFIKMEDFQRNIFIKYRYKFISKNQIFGTCWANAYAAAIFLTNKRILGRKTESFEDIRQQLIKYGSDIYIDGGNIENTKVSKFFQRKKLHYKEIDEYKAKKIIEKGGFVVGRFSLTDTQWKNFRNFYRVKPNEILTKEKLNEDCENKKNEEEDGHSVLLIEADEKYLKFLNSWGSNWANGGRFKIKNADVLTSYNQKRKVKFYDISNDENGLTLDEKNYYKNYIQYINDLISYYSNLDAKEIINDIKKYKKYTYKCKNCNIQMRFQDLKIIMEKGVYKMICPTYKDKIDVDGRLREYLLLRDLMDDGNENFDYNQNYEITFGRVEFHEKLLKNSELKNESDSCSIGLKNSKAKKIDSYFNNKVNCIINLKDNIFIACGSGVILIFELIIKKNDNNEDKLEYNILIKKDFSNVELMSLCPLKNNHFVVSSDNILYFLHYDNKKKILSNKGEIRCKSKINKILLLNIKNSVKKMIITCDNSGYTCTIQILEDNKDLIIYPPEDRKCHESSISSIIYLPDDNIFVSGSNEDKKLIFYDINEKGLSEPKNILDNTYSTKYTESLIDIKSYFKGKFLSYLLIGEEDGISIIEHNAHEIINSKYYKDEEFGGVYSIKSLGNNYIICGRSFGFCSIFLLQGNDLMKINVFRNNNLNASNKIYDLKKDFYYITNICVKDVKYEKENYELRYILIGSFDRTLKVYYYFFRNI